MPYRVQQNQEIPFNITIVAEDGTEALSLPLRTYSTDMTPDEARQHPDNMPVAEFAHRVALSLSFVENIPLMSLAMGVQTGGARAMAQAVINAEAAAVSLKAMVVGFGQCGADTRIPPEERLKMIEQMVNAANFANEPKVAQLLDAANAAISEGIASGELAPIDAPAVDGDAKPH